MTWLFIALCIPLAVVIVMYVELVVYKSAQRTLDIQEAAIAVQSLQQEVSVLREEEIEYLEEDREQLTQILRTALQEHVAKHGNTVTEQDIYTILTATGIRKDVPTLQHVSNILKYNLSNDTDIAAEEEHAMQRNITIGKEVKNSWT